MLAGDAPIEEKNLEEILGEEASLCLVYSNSPGGRLFANDPMLRSPFTDQFVSHVYNPGGGSNNSGGNYPMMFADLKSSVMMVCLKPRSACLRTPRTCTPPICRACFPCLPC